MQIRIVAAVSALVIVAGVSITAQGGRVTMVPPPASRMKIAEPWLPERSKSDTKIIGTVIDIRQVAVSRARLQLRNLSSGTVVQTGESNENGEYEFTLTEPGTYVVEMIMVDGYIVALSNAGSLARYETMQTVIQLPGRWDAGRSNMTMQQNVANFVGMSANTTMTAATIELAMNQNITPADPGEPVSP